MCVFGVCLALFTFRGPFNISTSKRSRMRRVHITERSICSTKSISLRDIVTTCAPRSRDDELILARRAVQIWLGSAPHIIWAYREVFMYIYVKRTLSRRWAYIYEIYMWRRCVWCVMSDTIAWPRI